jgi:MYXO-CTERM domain-containing protein
MLSATVSAQFGGGDVTTTVNVTPEPGAFGLLGVGLLALGARRFHRHSVTR